MINHEKLFRTVVYNRQQPTEAQVKEIEAASVKPIAPDEDAPGLTSEQYAEMAEIGRQQRNQRKKDIF